MKGADANPGDLIRIKTAKEEIEGILLESHELGVVLVKLKNGYNIGISRDNILDITIVKKAEKKEIEGKDFKFSHKKPVIDLIMTGGTISSSLDSKTGGVKWLTSPGELFKFYPEIFELADIRVINPFMKSSENMDSEDWKKLAKIVVKSLNDDSVKGVILTHGTDFLHYTSSALSFMISNLNKPVVLTYSQRSSDRGSSDAELNLYCAAKVALSDIAEVMLVGHGNSSDEFCYALAGTKVRKMHSSRRDAFKPINSMPLAKIFRDKIEILRDYNQRKTGKEAKAELNDSFEPNVALVKFYPGQDPDILNYYAKNGYKGIVIEVSGLGHVLTEGSKNWIPVIKELVKKRIIICASCQT
ncbi:MAG: Glu-tRNA(Gln) amidotransferase subunit GatD, partial [archaeon]|nr:Glu-tRNA(Gln) amidotransferase subunit GatD [archaeon]